MENKDIRARIRMSDLRHWQVADRIGISPCTLTVWLRHELTPDHRRRVEKAIESLEKERAEGAMA